MLKHSKGPWRWDRCYLRNDNVAGHSSGLGNPILYAPNADEMSEADKALLAAAPEMLALLREALPDPLDALVWAQWLERVQALLARLDG